MGVMTIRRNIAAIKQATASVELSRSAKEQAEAAILASLKLLRHRAYPDDRLEKREP